MRYYSIAEWCKMLGISHSMFYKLQKLGQGPKTFKIGRRTLISEEAAQSFVQASEAAAKINVDNS